MVATLVMVAMMLISRRSDIMGNFVIGWPLLTLGWVTTALMMKPCRLHENECRKTAMKSAPWHKLQPIAKLKSAFRPCGRPHY